MFQAFFITGVLFFLGHALLKLFQLTKIPDLLILTMVGYLAGPVFGWITPEDLGKAGGFLSEMALVAILLEGGFALSLKLFKEQAVKSLQLSFLAFFLAAIFSAVILTFLTPLTIPLAIYAGLCLGSTSSAIVIPLLKFLTVPEKIKTVLTLESALTDVMAIVFGLFLLETLAGGSFTVSAFLSRMFNMTISSVLSGIAFGFGLAILKKFFPNISDVRFSTLAAVFMIYGLMGMVGFNGALAVLALGMTLGNLPSKRFGNLFPADRGMKDTEVDLLQELIFILKIFFFIYLGVLVRFNNIWVILTAIILSIALLVTRYLATRITFSKKESKNNVKIVFSMFPRGLACAVVASLPLQRNIPGGDLIQNFVFATVPLTILGTSILAYITERNMDALPLFRSYATDGPQEPPPLPAATEKLPDEPC